MACITSTAEPIASFKLWMSACRKINVMVIISLYCEDFGTKLFCNYTRTIAPPTTGRRRVLAFKASIAPTKEIEWSLSKDAQFSKEDTYKKEKEKGDLAADFTSQQMTFSPLGSEDQLATPLIVCM